MAERGAMVAMMVCEVGVKSGNRKGLRWVKALGYILSLRLLSSCYRNYVYSRMAPPMAALSVRSPPPFGHPQLTVPIPLWLYVSVPRL
ncbi:hypothetical protein L1887_34034 [Cichorium endivia]|nr:hypothetical protein L1887_34034 [Cichorium endivia]